MFDFALHHATAGTTAYRRRGPLADGPRIVERSRGTAHPKVPTIRPNRVVARRRGDESALN